MSALPPKADIDWRLRNVRFVPQADIPRPLTDASDVSNRLIAWSPGKSWSSLLI